MNVILVGCEYAGKTTLALRIDQWAAVKWGYNRHFHDHFSIPSGELSHEAQESYKAAHPEVKEMFQRFMIEYHASDEFYDEPDHNLMGFVTEEEVYAPLYYGYGGKDSQAPERAPEGQRSSYARHVEGRVMQRAPHSVLVLVKASPDVIRRRMKEDPHRRQIVREKDIEHVLGRFEEAYESSLIRTKFALDTSTATEDETLAEFVRQYEPHISEADRQRMLVHRELRGSE